MKDLEKALFWYKLFEKSAKYEGEKKYVSFILPKITSEMNSEQVNRVEEKVQKWLPSPEDCKPRDLW